MEALLSNSWFVAHTYIFLFLAAIVEGPVVMTFSGFLLKMQTVSFWPVYAVLMAGDLVADSAWYLLGYSYAAPFIKKYGKWFGVQEPVVVSLAQSFKRHHVVVLLISKITMGFGFSVAVLIAAGMSRVRFRSYILLNAVGQCVWTAVLLAVGYFFGNLYVTINRGFRDLAVVVFVASIVAFLYGFSRFLRKEKLLSKI